MPRWLRVGLIGATTAAAIFGLPLVVVMLSRRVGAGVADGIRIVELVYSWPTAVVVAASVLAFLFRDPIAKALGGIKSFRAWQLEATFGQHLIASTGDPRKGEISWDNWAIEMIQRFSPTDREVLQRLGDQQRQALLSLVKWWWFERIWNQTYGTQALLVEKLADHGPSLSWAEADLFFEEHLRRLGELRPEQAKLVSAPQHREAYRARWYGFLQNALLVAVDPNKINLTPLGTEFRDYSMKSQYTSLTRAL